MAMVVDPLSVRECVYVLHLVSSPVLQNQLETCIYRNHVSSDASIYLLTRYEHRTGSCYWSPCAGSASSDRLSGVGSSCAVQEEAGQL